MSLILRIRSEVLKRNLEEIRQKVDQPPLGKRFTELGDAWRASIDLLGTLQEELHQLKREVQKDALSRSEFRNRIEDIENCSNDLFRKMDKIGDDARKLSEAYPFTMRVRARPRVGQECAEELAKILVELNRPEPDLKLAWSHYQAQYAEAQNLLSEYLEYIGGLSVRGAGFDDGMCKYADQLIALVGGPTSSSMAIPARQETLRMTWGRIVRMGCPEWTLWALPLTAHDVWYTAAQENLKIENLQDFTDQERWIQECLADAYAVWSTGPAYAYAAFFLRLDPFCVSEDREGCTHDLRAYAILKMWELMDKADANNLPYSQYRNKLTQEWLDALAYAPVARQKDDGELNFPENKEKKSRLDELMPLLFNTLQQSGISGFSVENWKSIQDWPDKLRNGDTIEHPEADFRWVLNAAWVARIEHPEQQTSVIHKGAAAVWDGITHRIDRGNGPGGRPHQPGRN